MRMEGCLEAQLVHEAQQPREEASFLPPGDLRDAVEETAEYAERLLALVRSHDTGAHRNDPFPSM